MIKFQIVFPSCKATPFEKPHSLAAADEIIQLALSQHDQVSSSFPSCKAALLRNIRSFWRNCKLKGGESVTVLATHLWNGHGNLCKKIANYCRIWGLITTRTH
jgi:hypothetical protein